MLNKVVELITFNIFAHIGRFCAELTNYEQCLHPSETFAYCSAHNNSFLTLHESTS